MSARVIDLAHDAEIAFLMAKEVIAKGECIVLPTDTIYGIGADPFSRAAVDRLLAAKHRGSDMPPPILAADIEDVKSLVSEISEPAQKLIEVFWPGALTVVLPTTNDLDLGDLVGSVAIRIPDNPLTRALLRHTGPLAVSSANISSHPPATNINDAIDQLGSCVSLYLDGGNTPGSAASSIVDFVSDKRGKLVRSGVLSYSTLKSVSPQIIEG